MSFSENIARRELFKLGKRVLFLIAGWKFLFWPRQVHSRGNFHSQLSDLIGYLLYENHPPSHLQEKIGKHVQELLSSVLEEKLKQKIFSQAGLKNFKDLSPEDKRVAVKKILPELLQHPEIIDIINNYLQGDRAMQFLGYPDLGGEFGECGWLILEGGIWDRYYPPSG